MKLYRVAIDYFTTQPYLESFSNKKYLFESIYYNIGYIPFRSSNMAKPSYLGYNSIRSEINGDGKYFFVFPFDAYKYANEVVYAQTPYVTPTARILEYDIPLDVALNHLGYGVYSNNNDVVETFVEKKQLGDRFIPSYNFDKSTKREYMTSHILEVADFVKKYKEYSESEISEVLKRAVYSIENDNSELCLSKYITGRYWIISTTQGKEHLHMSSEEAEELIKSDLLNSKNDSYELEKDIIELLHNNDTEEVKRILSKNI